MTIDITHGYACYVPQALRDLGAPVGRSVVHGIEDRSSSTTYRYEVAEVRTVRYVVRDMTKRGEPESQHTADLHLIGGTWWYEGGAGWREWTTAAVDGGRGIVGSDYYAGTAGIRWDVAT